MLAAAGPDRRTARAGRAARASRSRRRPTRSAWNGRTPRFVECDPRPFQIDLDDAAALPRRCQLPCWRPTSSVRRATRAGSRRSRHDAGVPVVFDAAHAFGAAGRRTADRRLRRRRGVQPHADQGARRRRGRARRHRRRRPRRAAADRPRLRQPRRLRHAVRRAQRPHVRVPRRDGARVARDLDGSLERRRHLARRYADGLADIPGIMPQVVAVAATARRTRTSRSPSTPALRSRPRPARRRCWPPKASTPATTSIRRCTANAAYRLEQERALPVTDATSSRVVSLPDLPRPGR